MALIFELKVVPSSGRSGFVRDKSGMIKCFLKSPAQDGKANRELIKTIAQAVGVTQQEVTIVSGLTGRKKKIKITGELSLDRLYQLLGIDSETQKTIY